MRVRKIYRQAQLPPMPPMGAGPGGPGAPPGMPPPGGPGGPPPGGPPSSGPGGPPPGMGGPPPGMPPPPGGPPPGGPQQKIGSPLATVFEVLYDADIMSEIQGAGKSIDEIASDIWTQYGGTETGGIDPTKVGERNPNHKDVTPEQIEQEADATENSKWKRLSVGKSIGDITTLDELKNSIEGIMSGLKKPPAPPGGGPGGPPGMPPGLAKVVPILIKLASLYDNHGRMEQADIIDRIWNQRAV